MSCARVCSSVESGLLPRGLRLRDLCLARVQGCHRSVVGGLARIVVLAGDELLFVELLGTLPVEFLLLEVGLALGLRGDRGVIVGLSHFHARFCGLHISRLRFDVGARLNIFKVEQDVSLVDAVAFFYGNVGDLADALAENVGVVLGSNLAGGGNDRGEALAYHGPGLDGDRPFIQFVDAEPRSATQDDNQSRAGPQFLPRRHCVSAIQEEAGRESAERPSAIRRKNHLPARTSATQSIRQCRWAYHTTRRESRRHLPQ